MATSYLIWRMVYSQWNFFLFNEVDVTTKLLYESKKNTILFTWNIDYLHGMMMCWSKICRPEGMLHAYTIWIIRNYINNIIYKLINLAKKKKINLVVIGMW